eukprot:CAMPEP_0119039012 /NCGR_PEP_ID=MMETSP1177-20130426/8263_1 /TAXON_ID=2985 /ORGANISM="Ochromonas sp, Strain CCMP1899" /LENGTH=43 /DNA_ID= /DNA_START= /DNA_END= /DNA_ORIENTATION=
MAVVIVINASLLTEGKVDKEGVKGDESKDIEELGPLGRESGEE